MYARSKIDRIRSKISKETTTGQALQIEPNIESQGLFVPEISPLQWKFIFRACATGSGSNEVENMKGQLTGLELSFQTNVESLDQSVLRLWT